MSRSPAAFHVGDPVAVFYNPRQPQQASIDSFMEVWGVAVLLGAAGLVGLIIGAGLIYWPRIAGRFKGATAPPAPS